MAIARLGVRYTSALGCVGLWRGVWNLWDWATLSTVADVDVVTSGLMSHFAALGMLLPLGYVTAVYAAPARQGLLSDRDVWSQAFQGSPTPWWVTRMR